MLNQYVNWLFTVFLSFTLALSSNDAFAMTEDNANMSTSDSADKQELDKKHPHYVRAVLLSKIAGYVYWQSNAFESAQQPFNICVVESDKANMDELWPYLSLLNGRVSAGRKFTLTDISKRYEDTEQLPADCHIYYFGEIRQKHSKALIQNAAKTGILTIADSMEELYDGAMLAFIEERGRMKIYVNTEAVDKGGLKIKSSLLRIAKKI